MNYGNPFLLKARILVLETKKKEQKKCKWGNSILTQSLHTKLTLLFSATLIYKSYLLEENPNDIAQNILY